jgi:CRP/FNR family transcriptional regulator, cyclic AMP receptor protein
MTKSKTLATLKHGFHWLRRSVYRSDKDRQALERVEALRRSPLFTGMPVAVVAELAETVHERRYRRDEFLYVEGDPGLGIYIIRRGSVRLVRKGLAGDFEDAGMAVEGDIVGLPSLFGDFRRLESAQAANEVEVLGFFRPDLNHLIKRRPWAGAVVLGAFSRKLAEEYRTIKASSAVTTSSAIGVDEVLTAERIRSVGA